ncbi:MAG TPA: glycosyltransferase, partial [Chitinophagales bacterium]|nr:glycosyltransferase [Chitinophagales bacterium]
HPADLLTAFYSVYNQAGVQPYPLLLVNDGSTNTSTLQALNMIALHERVSVINLPQHSGSSVARNAGLQAITTDYVMLMDSDDIAAPDKFRLQVGYMLKHRPHILGTNLFSFKNADITRTRIFTTTHLELPKYNNGWLVNQGTVLYHRQSVIDTGGYNPAIKIGQDVDLWKRMYKAGYTFRNLTQVLYAWRRY